MKLLKEICSGLLVLSGYYVCTLCLLVVVLFLLHRSRIARKEGYRKFLRMIQVISVLPVVYGFASGLAAALGVLIFMIAVWLVLLLLERKHPGFFGALVAERHRNEGVESLFLSFGTLAVLCLFLWQLLQHPDLVVLAYLTWGCSNAAAGLADKTWGRSRIRFLLASPKKYWQGATAGFLVSTLVILICIWLTGLQTKGSMPFLSILLLSLVCTLSGLCSWDEMDSVVSPLAVGFAAILLF